MKQFIQCPNFTPVDEYILSRIDKAKLAEWIDFLRSFRKVMWRDNDTGDLVPPAELRKRKLILQPEPEYPHTLMEMGYYFWDLLRVHKEFILNVRETGFFTEDSLVSLCTGTLWSAALTANIIVYAFVHERLADGTFGEGVENGLYLKLLLHLEDLAVFYQTIENRTNKTEK